MTHTISPEIYGNLLLKHQPRIIKTEAENEQFLAVVEELMARPKLTLEEEALLELLVKLIEDFEEKHYSLDRSTPHSRLLHLMDARNLQQSDLAEVLGSSEVAVEVMNGRKDINEEQAKTLARFFHVEPSLFLSK